MKDDSRHKARGHSTGEFRNYAVCRPAILVLLKEYDSHGYELCERLAELGFDSRDSRDSASIYRILRTMEKEGLTTSSWDVSKVGPPRRVYAITAEGDRYLKDCQELLERQRDGLDAMLRRYRSVASATPLRALAPS